MSKKSKNINGDKKAGDKAFGKSHDIKTQMKNDGYLLSMNHAPGLQESSHWVQMLPALFFTAVVIIITRMASYERPMGQFFWNTGKNDSIDFFSYYKMYAILICAVLVLIFLLYRAFIQAFYIKRSFAYIPMIVYTLFVLLSYFFSDYKEFSLLGWQDRFEGTLTLISYMIMLFYVINTVNSEKNVKLLIYSLAAVSTLLGLLGLTQALGHDFFQTDLGKKLITPAWFWDQIDNLNFIFKNNEIYQTVYNINYVSFYLTLLIPIFGILFIRSAMLGKEEALYKKILWGALFAFLIFNLIGSASSGGLMGMAFVILVAAIILNKKIIKWIKPVAVLILITILVGGISYQRWMPELSNTIDGVIGKQTETIKEINNINHKLDFMVTKGDTIVLGYQGEQVIFKTYPDDPSAISVVNTDGTKIPLKLIEEKARVFQLDDTRFDWITMKPGFDKQQNNYIIISTDGHDWPFQLTNNGPKYLNGAKKLVDLREVPAIGWENNQSFGSGRGYIWSRTLPMMKDTLVLGRGADTYSIYFPQDDYVGKYNSGAFSAKLNVIVDKPHNLYMGYIIGTGGISMLALLVLWFSYIVQSAKLYWKRTYTDFLSCAGLGIFLGICGFLAAALVNDSNVSVTPMFYGLLGTGIATNMMLKNSGEEKI